MPPFRLHMRSLPARNFPASGVVGDASARLNSAGVGAEDERAPVVVPWRIIRRTLGVIEIEYRGTEPAYSVRFALSGAGLLGLSLPAFVEPGARLRVAVRGAHVDDATAGSDAILVLRWYQTDGTELLWPIAIA